MAKGLSMKTRKRHSPEQIVKKLRDADAMLAAAKCDRCSQAVLPCRICRKKIWIVMTGLSFDSFQAMPASRAARAIASSEISRVVTLQRFEVDLG
jgi:hypothetical protein